MTTPSGGAAAAAVALSCTVPLAAAHAVMAGVAQDASLCSAWGVLAALGAAPLVALLCAPGRDRDGLPL